MEMYYLVFTILSLTSFKLATSDNTSEVCSRMESNGIVPDVIPTAPTNVLQVSYQSGKLQVNGNELKPNDLKESPTVTWDADTDSYYTLIMADPDAPSRQNPTAAQWRHWLVVNIPGSDLDKGETITKYAGPTPPKGTGLHRYVMLVYKQPSKLEFEEAALDQWPRNKFSVSDFVQKYKLQDPVAGNFYQAQNK